MKVYVVYWEYRDYDCTEYNIYGVAYTEEGAKELAQAHCTKRLKWTYYDPCWKAADPLNSNEERTKSDFYVQAYDMYASELDTDLEV